MVAQHKHKVNVIINSDIIDNYTVSVNDAPFAYQSASRTCVTQKVFHLFLCSGKLNVTVSEIFPDTWEQGGGQNDRI